MSEGWRPWVGRAPWLLAALAGAVIVLHSLLWVVRLWDPVPLMDSWSFLDQMLAWTGPGYVIERLWEQHNEHRILFPRLVFFADHLLAGGRQIVEPLVIALNQALLALLLWRFARRALPARTAAVFLPLALACTFSAVQMENLFWAFQVQFVGVLLAAAAAFGALTFARERPALFPCSLVLMLVASLMMANGLLVWPLGVLLAWFAGHSRARLGALLAGGLLVFAFYLHDYESPSPHRGPLQALAHLPEVLAYACACLGSPWRKLGLDATVALGAAAAGGLLLAAVVCWRRRTRLDHGTLAWLGVAAFAATTAGLTGLGRSGFPLETALTSRYSSPTLLAWLVLAAFVAAACGRRLGPWLLLSPLLPLLVWQKDFVRDLFPIHQQRDRGALALQLGADCDELVTLLYPDAKEVRPFITLSRQHRWGAFADGWQDLVGARLADRFTGGGEPLAGGLFRTTLVEDDEGLLSMRGWTAGHSPRHLVVTDDSGRILGLGRGGLTYPPAEEGELPGGAEGGGEWQALARLSGPGPVRLRLHAVEQPTGSARPIGDWHEVVPSMRVTVERAGAPLAPAEPVRIQGAFAREARHPSAPAADGRWPFWGSCVNGDEDTGRLELAPVPAPESRVLAVPFLTGPSTQGLSLEIVDPDRQTGVARMAAVEASADAWHAWVVRLPEATQRVVLVAEDRGKEWGQWIAVGPPCALLPRRPDGSNR